MHTMAKGEGLRFLGAMLRKPGSIGAIAPSSPSLAKRMIRGIDLTGGAAVVELGPGTGPITRQIHRAIPNKGRYLGIEIEPAFVRMLESEFPEMRFVEGSAERAQRHLREAGLEGDVRAIISGLPFATLPPRVQDRIIVSLDRLMKPGVVFRTFQYVHSWPLPAAVRFRGRMNRLFGPCRVGRPVMRNLPPALVLSWQRL